MGRRSSASAVSSPALSMRIFLGIFVRAAQYTQRGLTRSTMLSQLPPNLDYRFVTCGGANTRLSTAHEPDVLVLNVSNNVAGKGLCGGFV